jgi:hypothetical protein
MKTYMAYVLIILLIAAGIYMLSARKDSRSALSQVDAGKQATVQPPLIEVLQWFP